MSSVFQEIGDLSCTGSLSQQNVDLFLDPRLVVRGVGVSRLLINQNAKILQLVHEVEQLADVVCYSWLQVNKH